MVHARKDGIAFWLTTRGGDLFHVSDSIPKRLAPMRPFTWYGVEVDYDVARGRYDLRIFEEGAAEPVVALAGQPNAASQPGSAIDKFSFIGDNGDDRSNVTYYVDDVLLAAERPLTLPPFSAPGRRKFFADSSLAAALAGVPPGRLEEARRWLELPAAEALATASPAQLLAAEQLFAVLMVEGRHAEARDHALRLGEALAARGDAAASWLERAGDAAFQARDAEEARRLYSQALRGATDPAPLYLKLADTLYLLGDLAGEKRLRETIYGTLDAR